MTTPAPLTFRPARPDEVEAVSALALRVFAADAAADHTEEGVAEYGRFAGVEAMRARDARLTVAEAAGGPHPVLVGMLEIRDGTHVALLFVDPAHQRRGVGRALLEAALGPADGWPTLTVNSTPSAVGAYERLGFREAAPVREQKGIRFVPMTREGAALASGGDAAAP